MVCVLNCSFKFLNFKTWILQLNSIFYTLPLKFTSLENVFTLVFYLLNSIFLFDLAPCTLSSRFVKLHCQECNFQLDKQILIHCYFLLVLMPKPVLYILLRCQFCIWYSLAAFRQSPCQISNSTSYLFNSSFEFLFTLQWSLVETKQAFVGVRDGDLSTFSPGSFVHDAFLKEGVGRQRKTSTSNQNVWKCCLLYWNVKLFTAAKEGLTVL